jgi:hypothetical protein
MSLGQDHIVTLVAIALARQDRRTAKAYDGRLDLVDVEQWLDAAHAVFALGQLAPIVDSNTADVIGFEWKIVTRREKYAMSPPPQPPQTDDLADLALKGEQR